MKNIKKYGVVGIIVVFCFTMIFFLLSENKELRTNNSALAIEKQVVVDNTDTYGYLNSITVDSFEKKVRDGDNLFVYIGNSVCTDCSVFSETLKNEVENFPLKHSLSLVEISGIHPDKKRWLDFKSKYGFDQTPSFLLIQNGKVTSMIEWDENDGLSSETFHSWLEENKSFIQQLEN